MVVYYKGKKMVDISIFLKNQLNKGEEISSIPKAIIFLFLCLQSKISILIYAWFTGKKSKSYSNKILIQLL